MGTDFKLTTEVPQARSNVTVLHLAGWLDAHSERTIVDAVQKAKDSGAKFILIDLREADTITSAGIRALHQSFLIMNPKEEAHKVARLKLCNAPAQIYQVLSITGILVNAPMYESMDDAIESFEL
jgi:anti-anti-sigma factor